MSRNDQERRNHVRLPLSSNMMVRYGHRGQYFFGSCQNISPGGLFIATKSPAPFGSEIVLKFTLPGHESPISVKGRVVRVNRDMRSSSTTPPAGMHIRFTQLPSRTEELLKRFLTPRLRQHVLRQLAERRKK